MIHSLHVRIENIWGTYMCINRLKSCVHFLAILFFFSHTQCTPIVLWTAPIMLLFGKLLIYILMSLMLEATQNYAGIIEGLRASCIVA